MASAGEGNQTESVVENESSRSRNSRYKPDRLINFKKSLFNSPFSAPVSDTEPDPWVQKCNGFQVDMQVDQALSSNQQEAHKERLEKLRQELDYIKTDAWKYKPIEELIGF